MNKDITPLNNKGEPHGYWEYYLIGGQLVYKRFFHNGKQIGYAEWYHWNNSDKLNKKAYNI